MKENNLNGVFQNFSVRCEFDRSPQPVDLTSVGIITFNTETILRIFSWIRSRYEQIVDLSIMFQTLAFDLENIFIRKFIIWLTYNSSENCIIITINGMPPRLSPDLREPALFILQADMNIAITVTQWLLVWSQQSVYTRCRD